VPGSYIRFFTFTPQQEQRAGSIRKRTAALQNFRLALATRSPWRLVKAYDPILNAHITPTERELLAWLVLSLRRYVQTMIYNC